MTGTLARFTPDDYHPLEVSSGFLRGREQIAPLEADPAPTARQALEAVVLRALQRPPCVVSFSGGRDSSTVLALATRVADREGLPRPLPVTLRFPSDAASEESEWQETLVRHLGLRDWERVALDQEVDLVGPVAESVLRRHGLLYPVNAHFHVPILEHARGGALLTGIGGDEVLSATRYRRLQAVLAGQERPRPRDVVSALVAYAPASVRAAAIRRRDPYRLPWLTPVANRHLERWRARSISEQEVRWDRWITVTWWSDRGRIRGERSIAAIAADVGAMAVHPFEDPVFLTTVARERGAAGFRSRREALDILVSDVLPTGFSRRTTKASFNRSFFGTYSRAMSEAWDGRGLDEYPIVPEALRRVWREPIVDARSQWLLQVLRLRQLGPLDRGQESPDSVIGD